jgi:sugar phosphate isomerase/epimerase
VQPWPTRRHEVQGAIVRLGFFTACLLGVPLEDIAGWAAAHGYDALEIAHRTLRPLPVR